MEAPQISPPVLRFGAFFPRPAGTAGAPSPRALARCCGRMGAKGSKDNASETEEAVSVAPPTAAEPTQPGCPRCGLPGEGAGAFCQCRSCKTYMSHTQLYSRVEPLVPKKKGPQVDPLTIPCPSCQSRVVHNSGEGKDAFFKCSSCSRYLTYHVLCELPRSQAEARVL